MPEGAGRQLAHLWDAPHKPFFLAAGFAAIAAVAWWPLGAAFGLAPPAFPSPILWHIHEVLFGVAAAALAGYLLTALPAWTGAPPLRGGALKALVLLWALARGAVALADVLPLVPVLLAGASFFALLAVRVAGPILRARVFAKLGLCLAAPLLGCSEMVFLGAALTGRGGISFEVAHLVVLGFALLMTGIAARAIPAFTRNALAPDDRPVTDRPPLRLLVQALLFAALLARLAGWQAAADGALVLAALGLLAVMRGWRTLDALRNPLLAALHLSFLWLALGLGAVGFAGGFPAYPVGDALHAITIGAMAGMIMALAGRASACRIAGVLVARRGFLAAVGLIWLATVLRLCRPLVGSYDGEVVIAAALLWCAGWAVFVAQALPATFRPVARPVLSGRRHLPPHLLSERTP